MARTRVEEPPAVEKSLPIHIKYRPQTLDDVWGQKPIIKSLQAALKASTTPHTYLFTGDAGTGKTTLARIIATLMKCSPENTIEVDAATNSGVDAMREVTSALQYNGFGDTPNKAIIIDECHRLSASAWDSLLKITEEPPPHVFFFFCSSVLAKIPVTMQRRCAAYALKPVSFDDVFDLLADVCKQEAYDTPDKTLNLIAEACNGSPGMALTMLSKVHALDVEDAAELLQHPLEDAEVIDLCRLLVSGKLTWERLVEVLKSMPDTPPETIRIIIVNYLNACLLGARSRQDVPRLLDMLAAFSKPCNQSDKLAPILLAFGAWMFD